MPQNNFLLIGLGGTGCAVIREVKKKLYTEWRRQGNSGPYPEVYRFQSPDGAGRIVESRIATLSIDSNDSDLKGEGDLDTKWSVLGQTLGLGDREKVLISPVGLHNVFANLGAYPGIQPWVQDEMDFVKEITVGTVGPTGCNQIRRMGRLAFANGNNKDIVLQAVNERLNQLAVDHGDVNAKIHIFCTLAAGTGSGTVIDVVAQIQKALMQASGTDYPLCIHGFATNKDVGSTNTGNFYANQYAALQELNAFRLAFYRPWDIRVFPRSQRLQVPAPDQNAPPTAHMKETFKSVSLISDTTAGGISLSLDQQVENVAELMFQLSVRQMGNVPDRLRKGLTGEDAAVVQVFDDNIDRTRSTAFVGYGVQRAAIPERVILEKLTYTLGRQFLLKILYNYWDNGYRDMGREFQADTFVSTKLDAWRLTRGHLCLDRVEEAPAAGLDPFKPYGAEWNEKGDIFHNLTKTRYADNHEKWLNDFDVTMERHWTDGFRAVSNRGGVNSYFAVRKEDREKRNRIGHIRARLEQDLIDGMERMDPEYALCHLPSAVAYLLKYLEIEKTFFGKEADKAVAQVKTIEETKKEIKNQYEKIGILAKLVKKPDKLFAEYKVATIGHYYHQTWQKAMEYARDFCGDLIEELEKLKIDVDLLVTKMKLTAEGFAEEIGNRLQESGATLDTEQVTYLVDAAQVNARIRDYFERNETVQETNARNIMEALQRLRGDHKSFVAYTDRMPEEGGKVGGPLIKMLYQAATESSMRANDYVVTNERTFEGILKQNIVYNLYREFGGRLDGGLSEWLRGLISRSMPMLSFNPAETPMNTPGAGPILRRCVFVPTCGRIQADDPGFMNHLQTTIEGISGSPGGANTVETYYYTVPEERVPNEISVITVAFFFSARFAGVVNGLSVRYANRMNQATERESRKAYFEVHTESHDPRLPDLLKPDENMVRERGLPTVLLAIALGLMDIRQQNNREVVFGTRNAVGALQDGALGSGMTWKESDFRAILERSGRGDYPRPISPETIVVRANYMDRFNTAILHTDLPEMVNARLDAARQDQKNGGTALDEIVQKLETLGNEYFILSGSDDDDPAYRVFLQKIAEARNKVKYIIDRL